MLRRTLIAFAALMVLALGAGAGWTAWLSRGLPTVAQLRHWQPERPLVPLSRIPKRVRQAFIATEDGGFYHEGAVSYPAIARAAWVDITHLRPLQGGSTITQQTARMLFLNHRKTLSRKLREWVLAWRLNRAWSKQRILDVYLNRIYLGSHAIGVRAAAHHYFHLPLRDLHLAQCATLAGLAANPSLFNPRRHPRAAADRLSHVLTRMVALNYIGPTRAQGARHAQMFASRDGHPHHRLPPPIQAQAPWPLPGAAPS